MPFTFSKVDLHVVTLNDKPWTSANEVCRALEYNKKTTKIAHIVTAHVSAENFALKCQQKKSDFNCISTFCNSCLLVGEHPE